MIICDGVVYYLGMSATADYIHFALPIPTERLAMFCKKWKLSRLELFGSVLREDFGPESDVDVLVTFQPNAQPTFLGMFAIQDELESLFGRRVDLLRRQTVEESKNPYRRKSILDSATVIYAD